MFNSNVLLIKVEVREHLDRGSGTVQYMMSTGEILVSNQSYNKRVGFCVNVDGQWHDFYAKYSHSFMTTSGNGCEVWTLREYGELLKSFSIPNPLPTRPLFQMAVFYNNLDWGTWYWDNNNGHDYFV